jgi:DNA invertase Pin-like site-specific DNA recombinase
METTKDSPDHHDPRRAAIYLRVSSREQAYGYSIPAQREACRRRIVDEGWTLAVEYCDSGESARTANRPQFQAMLQALTEDPSISVLLVHKLDRLARNLEDHVAIKARLRKLGVQLVSVSESIEESASGKLVEGIMASIAEFYSANLAQEVKKGMTQKARSGGWSGLAPIGYRNVRLATTATRRGEAVIIPDEEQAPLVRLAFERYATGDMSLKELHEEMGRQGLRGRTGKPLAVSSLSDLLHNRAYIGKVVWGGVEYEGTHEPLVDEDLWRRVQEVLRIHDKAGERTRRKGHYLKGTLFCGSCGSRLSATLVKQQYLYFYCIDARTGRAACNETYTKAAILEAQVEELYRSIQLPEQLLERLRRDLKTEVESREASRIRTLSLLRRDLGRLDTAQSRILDAYYQEAVTAVQLKKEQERIEAERKRLGERLRDAEQHLAGAMEVVGRAVELASHLHAAYTAADPLVRRRYNLALLGKLYVRDGRLVEAPSRPKRTASRRRHQPTLYGPAR